MYGIEYSIVSIVYSMVYSKDGQTDGQREKCISQSTNGRVARQQQLHDARRYVAATELLPMDFSGPCDEMMCWRWLCY